MWFTDELLLPVLGAACLWELLYRAFDVLMRALAANPAVVLADGSPAKLRERGATYAVAFVHAVLMTVRSS